MKISIFPCAAVFFAALASWQAAAWAQSAQPRSRTDDEGIQVTADKLSSGEGGTKVEASGNVEIKRQQSTLKADQVLINRETQDMEAKGKVSFDDPEWKVKSADSIQMNLEKETGEIQRGDIFLEQGRVSITGRRLQKIGGQAYHVDEGFFTTCLCESGAPSWKVSADSMDLNLDGLGTIKNGYFYVLDVPVLYIPYAFFPLKTERQTGFLFPRFGHSTKEGFRFQQPFYWAASKSTDATVAFDFESRARVGLLGEYRTMINRDSDFQMNASYFNEGLRKNEQGDVVDRTIANQDIPKDRWSIFSTHRYLTAAGWLTYSDVAAYRDDLFARELIERFDLPGTQESTIRRSRFAESRFGVFKDWGDTFFKGGWNFYQDFIQYDAETLQRTPQAIFWGRRFFAGLPLEFRWRAEGVNYMRRRGGDGLRLDLKPEILLPFRLGPAFFGSLSAAPRETVYHLYSPVKNSNRNISREIIELRGNIGTSLSRIFRANALGLSAVRHVIEPEISYLFVPSRDQSSIPIMDDVDRVNRRNVLTFSLANRFWGKFPTRFGAAGKDQDGELLNAVAGGNIQDMGYLKLALSYDIDKARKGGDSLSDLDVRLRLNPTNYLSMILDGGVDPGPWQVARTQASLTLSDPRPLPRQSADPDFNRANSFTVSYYFLRRSANSYLADDANIDLDQPADCVRHPSDPRCPGTAFTQNTVGNLGISMFYRATDNLLLYFSSTADTREARFLGVRGATKFLSFCECWSVTLGVSHDINPAKTSFNFDFNLLGLGTPKRTIK